MLGKVLIVSPRELTLETLHAFEMFFKAYSSSNDILGPEQVQKVVLGFQVLQIQNWYMVNETTINAMSFKAYVRDQFRVSSRVVPEWFQSGSGVILDGSGFILEYFLIGHESFGWVWT